MSYWFTTPPDLESGREFDCASYGEMTPEQCKEYGRHWVYWFESDHVYALPTVAFFLCSIGVFMIGYVTSQLRGYSRRKANKPSQAMLAAFRYLSYRSYHIDRIGYNSPVLGILLLIGTGTTYLLCMALVPQPYYWPNVAMDPSPPLGTRSGFLAIACMPFVFATASKANWITFVTGISHEKLNVFHRWISFAFFVLALLHSLPFVVYHIHFHDMVEQVTQVEPEEYWTGIVALILLAYLTFASLSPIRKLGYEFFKISHYFSATIFMIVFFWHCAGSLTSWDYFIGTAALYVPSIVYPWLRTCFEYGNCQRAMISVEEHGVLSISIPANFNWVPGQHCFLRFRGFGLQVMSSHPFSICSSPSIISGEGSRLTFYARHRGGLTARLYKFAEVQPKSTGVYVDGPYGGIDLRRFHASDRMLVIAGATAAGWILSFVTLFARVQQGLTEHAVRQTRSMRVILATRDEKVQKWFLRSIQGLLSQVAPSSSGTLSGLSIYIHLTRHHGEVSGPVSENANELKTPLTNVARVIDSQTDKEVRSSDAAQLNASSTVETEQRSGRPDLPATIEAELGEAAQEGQSVGVFVCGPPQMQSDVRNAVARGNLQIVKGSSLGGAYLYCEHYSWA